METAKAVATEQAELQDVWTKVLERKKQAHVWKVRSVDWTAEVVDVDKFAEGTTDPNRAAISAGGPGRGWRRVARTPVTGRSDGKPPPRVSAVMPWTCDEQGCVGNMPGPQLTAGRFQIKLPKIFPTTVVKAESRREIGQRAHVHNFWGSASRKIVQWRREAYYDGLDADRCCSNRRAPPHWWSLWRPSGYSSSHLRSSTNHTSLPDAAWIVREQEEEPQEYFARAENMATTLGLTFGDRQIGVRTGPPEGPVRYRRTWQVSRVPKEWQELQGKDFIEIQAGEHLIFVTPATSPAQRAQTTMRRVVETDMTFSKNECKQPRAWHRPVETAIVCGHAG